MWQHSQSHLCGEGHGARREGRRDRKGRRLVGWEVQAEARDDGISAPTCVSSQQAAAGVSKCAICDRVSHAIIACTSATDDESMLECMTPAERSRRATGHSFILRDLLRSPEEHAGQLEIHSQ